MSSHVFEFCATVTLSVRGGCPVVFNSDADECPFRARGAGLVCLLPLPCRDSGMVTGWVCKSLLLSALSVAHATGLLRRGFAFRLCRLSSHCSFAHSLPGGAARATHCCVDNVVNAAGRRPTGTYTTYNLNLVLFTTSQPPVAGLQTCFYALVWLNAANLVLKQGC